MKKFIIFAAVFFSISLICGCGENTETKYFTEGTKYFEEGDLNAAKASFEKSLNEEGETEATYRALGITLMNLQDYEGAKDAFINGLRKNNSGITEMDFDINYYLEVCYKRLKDYESAIKTCDAILALRPKEADLYLERGILDLLIGNKTAADEDFSKATAGKHSSFDKRIEVFKILKSAGYENDADNYLRALLNNDDVNKTDLNRGQIYYYLGEYTAAINYLEKVKGKKDPVAVMMLGMAYEKTGNNEYAASIYETYLNEEGNSAAIYNRLGVTEMNSEEYEKAMAAFSFGLKLNDPNYERILLYNEAICYEYTGDFKTALEKMKSYLAKYPGDNTAAKELIFLETR